jgi:hypothetical protein
MDPATKLLAGNAPGSCKESRMPTTSADNATARMRDALALLDRGVSALLESAQFASYLRLLARLHQYSARNVVLIHLQCPTATYVAGYHTWHTLGRQVRRGERGIRIIVPIRRRVNASTTTGADVAEAYEPTISEPSATDRDTVTGWRIGYVWDVRQTDGPALPAPPMPQPLASATATGAWVRARLTRALMAAGVPVIARELPGANGLYRPQPPTIILALTQAGDQATRTLVHEAAHHVALTQALRAHAASRAAAETIAESAAYVVLQHVGLDAGDYTFPYVAQWARERAVLLENLAAIQHVAHTLIGWIVPADEQPVPQPVAA